MVSDGLDGRLGDEHVQAALDGVQRDLKVGVVRREDGDRIAGRARVDGRAVWIPPSRVMGVQELVRRCPCPCPCASSAAARAHTCQLVDGDVVGRVRGHGRVEATERAGDRLGQMRPQRRHLGPLAAAERERADAAAASQVEKHERDDAIPFVRRRQPAVHKPCTRIAGPNVSRSQGQDCTQGAHAD